MNYGNVKLKPNYITDLESLKCLFIQSGCCSFFFGEGLIKLQIFPSISSFLRTLLLSLMSIKNVLHLPYILRQSHTLRLYSLSVVVVINFLMPNQSSIIEKHIYVLGYFTFLVWLWICFANICLGFLSLCSRATSSQFSIWFISLGFRFAFFMKLVRKYFHFVVSGSVFCK